jgi:hypothetical protein
MSTSTGHMEINVYKSLPQYISTCVSFTRGYAAGARIKILQDFQNEVLRITKIVKNNTN